MNKFLCNIFVSLILVFFVSVCGNNSSSGALSAGGSTNDAATTPAPKEASLFTEQADTYTGTDADESLTPLGGGDIINVGTGTDTIVYTAVGQTFSGFVSPGTTVLMGIDVVSGMSAGDKISLFSEVKVTSSTAVSPNLLVSGDARGLIAIVRGNYNETTKIFTEVDTGADTLVQWDTNSTGVGGDLESMVLKGYVQSLASQRSNGVITLQ